MWTRRTPWILVLAILGTAASAQEVEIERPLSLEQCIEIAMRSQVDVVTAQNNVTIAESRLKRNISSYLPQIAVQNNAFVLGSSGVLSKQTTGTALTVNQNVFDGGLREANVRSARHGVTQNEQALVRTRQSVTYDVTRAYYEVLRAKHLADVSRANVTYNEELREQIQARAEEGEAAQVDVLPVEAQLANARVNLLSAQNAVRIAAIDLQTAMGLTPQYGFDIQDIEAIPEITIDPLKEYVNAALESRPDLAQAQAGIGAARASVSAARLSIYPRVVVGADYQQGISGGFQTTGTQITGGIVFDLFNGGANRAAYKEAQAAKANADEQAQQLTRIMRAQVEEAYLNLTNSRERLSASEAGLSAAQKNLEAQKERYNQGLAIPLDLLNAEVQLVTAQSNAVQSKYDHYIAIAQMNYAVGRRGEIDDKQD